MRALLINTVKDTCTVVEESQMFIYGLRMCWALNIRINPDTAHPVEGSSVRRGGDHCRGYTVSSICWRNTYGIDISLKTTVQSSFLRDDQTYSIQLFHHHHSARQKTSDLRNLRVHAPTKNLELR